MKSCAHPVN